MAAGVNYGTHQILGDYPCNIKSIKRYAGGFNLIVSDFKYNKSLTTGTTLPPFYPVKINLTTREMASTTYGGWKPSEIDTDEQKALKATYYVVQCFLYNSVVLEEGATATAILSADEISFSGLEQIQTIAPDGTKTNVYEAFTKETRATFETTYPHCTFVA